MSFWAQLVAFLPDPKFNMRFIESMRSKSLHGSLDNEHKMELFTHTAQRIGQIVLILDGLDEVPRDENQQAMVVEILKKVQRKTQQCRILITSRPYSSIRELFQNDPQFELNATTMDLELYIRDRLSRADWYKTRGHRLCERIVQELIPKCKGLFLLSKLFMDDILKANNPKQCYDIIEMLPQTATEAYDRGLERLSQEFPPQRTRKGEDGLPCMPIQALFWVTHVKHPITESQLRQALAVDYEDSDYDSTREWFKGPGGIGAICGGLIIADHLGGLHVAHRSITEHLTDEGTRAKWFPTIHEHIPRVLLHYLLSDSMKMVDNSTNDHFVEKFPLCPYALAHWGNNLPVTLKRALLFGRLPKNSYWSCHLANGISRSEIKPSGHWHLMPFTENGKNNASLQVPSTDSIGLCFSTFLRSYLFSLKMKMIL